MYCGDAVRGWLVSLPQWLGGGSGTRAIKGGVSSPCRGKSLASIWSSRIAMHRVVHQVERLVE